MNCLLDDIRVDWTDFNGAAEMTQQVLRRLAGDKSLLATLVAGVEHQPRLLEMAEHHQLLDRMVIYDALDRGFRIRVHLTTNEHFERPHDHRFSFSSLIIRGCYKHIWHGLEDDATDEFDAVSAKARFVTTESEGACYSLHHSVIHTTVTTPDTVSLFLRGPAMKSRSMISDRASSGVTWRYGAADESNARRHAVQLGLSGYRVMCGRLRSLGLI